MPELVRTATIHHVHSNNSEHSLCKRLSHNYHAWRWVQINVPASAGQTLIVGGRTAVLGQFHWHASSEHTVDNLHHAMEMHFVLTYNDTGEQACTAVNCLHTVPCRPVATVLMCHNNTAVLLVCGDHANASISA